MIQTDSRLVWSVHGRRHYCVRKEIIRSDTSKHKARYGAVSEWPRPAERRIIAFSASLRAHIGCRRHNLVKFNKTHTQLIGPAGFNYAHFTYQCSLVRIRGCW